jgi:hypothetical protein
MSFWYHLSDDHNLRRANKKGQKRRWEAISSESNDDRRVEKKQKSTRPKETVEIEVIPSSAAKGYNYDSEVPDLTHTGSSPNSTMFCPKENSTSTRGYYDVGDFPSPLDFLKINHDMDSKELDDITVVDLTEDRPLIYNDLISQYTTILSSTCSSVKGDSDNNDNEGLSDLVSGKSCLPPEIEALSVNMVDCNPVELNQNVQIKPRKSGIRLRLNPPKPPTPTPKILLRIEQPEQLSSQKHHGPVRRNDRRVRDPVPTTKKPRGKRRMQN